MNSLVQEVVVGRVDPFPAARVGDGHFPAEPFQNDPDLLFRGVFTARRSTDAAHKPVGFPQCASRPAQRQARLHERCRFRARSCSFIWNLSQGAQSRRSLSITENCPTFADVRQGGPVTRYSRCWKRPVGSAHSSGTRSDSTVASQVKTPLWEKRSTANNVFRAPFSISLARAVTGPSIGVGFL